MITLIVLHHYINQIQLVLPSGLIVICFWINCYVFPIQFQFIRFTFVFFRFNYFISVLDIIYFRFRHNKHPVMLSLLPVYFIVNEGKIDKSTWKTIQLIMQDSQKFCEYMNNYNWCEGLPSDVLATVVAFFAPGEEVPLSSRSLSVLPNQKGK